MKRRLAVSVTDEPTPFDDCIYCGVPGCVDETGESLHTSECPFVTSIFPVDERHGEMVCPCCETDLAGEEFYTTITLDPCHPAVLEVLKLMGDDDVTVAFAVCLGCAVTEREISDI